MLNQLKALWVDEEGATMVEYALMLGLIAVVCIAAVTAIGTAAQTKFTAASTALGAAP
jgi:pilus assembly protein Flp/PilA